MKYKETTVPVLLALGYVVLGMILVIWPTEAAKALCWIIGICSLLFGVYHFVRYWQSSRSGFTFTFELVLSVIFVLLGIFCLVSFRTLLSFLPFILGIALVIDGAAKLPRAFSMREFGFSRWWVELLLALLLAILGLILIFDPFSLVRFSVVFFGASLVVSGISDLLMILWSSH